MRAPVRRKSRLPASAIGRDRKECSPSGKISGIEGSRRTGRRGEGDPLRHWLGRLGNFTAIGWVASRLARPTGRERRRDHGRGRSQRSLRGWSARRERGGRPSASQVLAPGRGEGGRGGAGGAGDGGRGRGRGTWACADRPRPPRGRPGASGVIVLGPAADASVVHVSRSAAWPGAQRQGRGAVRCRGKAACGPRARTFRLSPREGDDIEGWSPATARDPQGLAGVGQAPGGPRVASPVREAAPPLPRPPSSLRPASLLGRTKPCGGAS